MGKEIADFPTTVWNGLSRNEQRVTVLDDIEPNPEDWNKMVAELIATQVEVAALNLLGAGDLLADGTIPLTANWDVGAFKIIALQFESDIVTGTAPIIVASTTVVTNFNADTVDGIQGAELIQRDGSVDFTGKQKFTSAVQDWNDATDGATVTFDLSLSNKHRVIIAGNRTLALTNPTNAQAFTIRIQQDTTGSRTVTFFATIKWAGGATPTLTTTANKADTFMFIRTGVDTYDGFIVGQDI